MICITMVGCCDWTAAIRCLAAVWFSSRGATADADSILDLCRKERAAYKVPRAVQFVADLPKTSTGKIMRRALKTLDA